MNTLQTKFKKICSLSFSDLVLIILNKLRKKSTYNPSLLTLLDANKKIYELLINDAPCMITRFGSVEIIALTKYLSHNLPLPIAILKYINNKCNFFIYNKNNEFSDLKNNAGVFDVNEKNIRVFANEYLNAIPNIDLLGSWRSEEQYLSEYFSKSLMQTKLGYLEPYKCSFPWSKALKNKKVLVVHPFVKTIEKQYSQNRNNLFSNPDVLPEFNLITLKAVQTIAGEPTSFSSWMEALNFMKQQIANIDFDIAIIGCGAYGLPLAAYVKSIGKKAVHLGGSTQILFGIRGKRWDDREDFVQMFNEYWCYPSEYEKPKNAGKVENGCYW